MENDMESLRALLMAHHQNALGATDSIAINEIPAFSAPNPVYAGSYYYTVDYTKAKFTFFSDSMTDLLGISPAEGLKMSAEEYIEKVGHPEDLPQVMNMINQFEVFCKNQPFEKLKDLRHIISSRIKNKNGDFVKVVSQTCILTYASNKVITSVLTNTAVAAFISDFDIATGVIIDISSGEELASYSAKKREAEERLTKREIQILRLLAVGIKNKEVAEKLNISVHTVETHRKRIMSKLGVSAAIDLVWKAIEFNLVQAP